MLETEYENYVNAEGENLDGREQAHAPGYQYHLGVEWEFLPSFYVRGELEGRDDFFASATHSEQLSGYDLVNLYVGWESTDGWAAKVWARNVTGEDFFVRGFRFGNDPRDDYTARAFTQLGEPRRVGVTVSKTW